jgi:hypothetical protein
MTTEKSTVRLGVLYSVRQELPQEQDPVWRRGRIPPP